jgi:hypothetical protein
MALGLGLMLTTLCYGQSAVVTEGPPHNVIYWDGNQDSVPTLASSAYTDVITYFVVPDQNCLLSWEGGTPTNLITSIQTLHNAGKTVLVSFGGSDVQSSNYADCAVNMVFLEIQLNNIVTGNSPLAIGAAFDGLDIDFEDTNAFGGQGGYDGVNFLTQLTNDLSNGSRALPQWSIITHAPQTPYWTQNYNYNSPPYVLVYQKAGYNIAWFNNQFYNNCYLGNTDCTAEAKLADYQYIVNTSNMPPTQLVMGVPVAPCATRSCDGNGNGDGYIPLYDPTTGAYGNDMSTLISQLQQIYGDQFGGVMGWNYPFDLSYWNGTWGPNVSAMLTSNQPYWVGFNSGTGLCLDGSSNAFSNVYTDSCGGYSQNWRFNVNTIVNVQTGYCLDSDYYGNVYTDSCNTGNFQNWEFFGQVIFDRRTRLCLQDNSGNVTTAPCNPNNVYQQWGNPPQILP